jgi:hypothetical protein
VLLRRNRDGAGEIEQARGAGEQGVLTVDPEDDRVPFGKAEGFSDSLRHGQLALRRELCGDIHRSSLLQSKSKDTGKLGGARAGD